MPALWRRRLLAAEGELVIYRPTAYLKYINGVLHQLWTPVEGNQTFHANPYVSDGENEMMFQEWLSETKYKDEWRPVPCD